MSPLRDEYYLSQVSKCRNTFIKQNTFLEIHFYFTHIKATRGKVDHTKIEKSIVNSFIRGVLKYSVVEPGESVFCTVTKNANSKFELLIHFFSIFFISAPLTDQLP